MPTSTWVISCQAMETFTSRHEFYINNAPQHGKKLLCKYYQEQEHVDVHTFSILPNPPQKSCLYFDRLFLSPCSTSLTSSRQIFVHSCSSRMHQVLASNGTTLVHLLFLRKPFIWNRLLYRFSFWIGVDEGECPLSHSMTSNQPCLIDKPQKLGRNFCSRENWRGTVLACLAFVLQTCLFRPLPCVMYKNQHGLCSCTKEHKGCNLLVRKNILYEEPIIIYAWNGFYPHVCFTVTALPWNTSKIHFFFCVFLNAHVFWTGPDMRGECPDYQSKQMCLPSSNSPCSSVTMWISRCIALNYIWNQCLMQGNKYIDDSTLALAYVGSEVGNDAVMLMLVVG